MSELILYKVVKPLLENSNFVKDRTFENGTDCVHWMDFICSGTVFMKHNYSTMKNCFSVFQDDNGLVSSFLKSKERFGSSQRFLNQREPIAFYVESDSSSSN